MFNIKFPLFPVLVSLHKIPRNLLSRDVGKRQYCSFIEVSAFFFYFLFIIPIVVSSKPDAGASKGFIYFHDYVLCPVVNIAAVIYIIKGIRAFSRKDGHSKFIGTSYFFGRKNNHIAQIVYFPAFLGVIAILEYYGGYLSSCLVFSYLGIAAFFDTLLNVYERHMFVQTIVDETITSNSIMNDLNVRSDNSVKTTSPTLPVSLPAPTRKSLPSESP